MGEQAQVLEPAQIQALAPDKVIERFRQVADGKPFGNQAEMDAYQKELVEITQTLKADPTGALAQSLTAAGIKFLVGADGGVSFSDRVLITAKNEVRLFDDKSNTIIPTQYVRQVAAGADPDLSKATGPTVEVDKPGTDTAGTGTTTSPSVLNPEQIAELKLDVAVNYLNKLIKEGGIPDEATRAALHSKIVKDIKALSAELGVKPGEAVELPDFSGKIMQLPGDGTIFYKTTIEIRADGKIFLRGSEFEKFEQNKGDLSGFLKDAKKVEDPGTTTGTTGAVDMDRARRVAGAVAGGAVVGNDPLTEALGPVFDRMDRMQGQIDGLTEENKILKEGQATATIRNGGRNGIGSIPGTELGAAAREGERPVYGTHTRGVSGYNLGATGSDSASRGGSDRPADPQEVARKAQERAELKQRLDQELADKLTVVVTQIERGGLNDGLRAAQQTINFIRGPKCKHLTEGQRNEYYALLMTVLPEPLRGDALIPDQAKAYAAGSMPQAVYFARLENAIGAARKTIGTRGAAAIPGYATNSTIPFLTSIFGITSEDLRKVTTPTQPGVAGGVVAGARTINFLVKRILSDPRNAVEDVHREIRGFKNEIERWKGIPDIFKDL